MRLLTIGIILFFLLAFSQSCEQWDLELIDYPTLKAISVEQGALPTQINASAEISGLTATGIVDQHGHIWSYDVNLLTLDESEGVEIAQVTGNGQYTSTIENISPNRKVFVKPFIVYNGKPSFGETLEIVTSDLSAQISIDTIKTISEKISGSRINVSGSILNLPNGLSVDDFGVVYSQNENPNLDNGTVISDGQTLVAENRLTINKDIFGLLPGLYYLRTYLVVGDLILYSDTKTQGVGDFWVQKAEVDFLDELSPYSFSIGDQLWLGGGYYYEEIGFAEYFRVNRSEGRLYDPVNDQWFDAPELNQALDFLTNDGFSFTIGNKAYLGLDHFEIVPAPEFSTYNRSFFAVDLATREVTKTAAIPIEGQDSLENMGFELELIPFDGTPFAFGLEEKAYAGFDGFGGIEDTFWEYDPTSDRWTQLAAFPEEVTQFYSNLIFSVGNKGYLFCRLDKSVWAFDGNTKEWTRLLSYETENWTISNYSAGTVVRNSFYFTTSERRLIEFKVSEGEFIDLGEYPGLLYEGQVAFAHKGRIYWAYGQVSEPSTGFLNAEYFREVWEYVPRPSL